MSANFRCPEWIIEPDEVDVLPKTQEKEKYFICRCDLWICRWEKERIGKIRRRVADLVFKMPWRNAVELALKLQLNTV